MMSETTVTVRGRVRVQGRLKDHQEKWRDEITQELEISVVGALPEQTQIKDMARVLADMQKELFENLAAAGGMRYTAREFTEPPAPVAQDERPKCPNGIMMADAGKALLCGIASEGGTNIGPCEHRVTTTIDGSDEPTEHFCEWTGWKELQEDVEPEDRTEFWSQEPDAHAPESEPETEPEVIGSTGDIDIIGDEILKDCPATTGDESVYPYGECPLDVYDRNKASRKAEAEIWMLEHCTPCPKYQAWNTRARAPEVA